ncbi:unnamed protein product, partial [marine sediment metagenome]
LEVEFDVPDGLAPRQLTREILEEKENLDKAALTAEYLRGALTQEEFAKERGVLADRYAKAFGRSD